jgi:site-specific DNA recombinase
MAAAKVRQFEAIVVEAQDRLWRSQAEMHAALALLRFHGVKVFSVATGTDLTDYGGRVLATVLGLKDEIFLDDLRAKTHRGMVGAVLRGLTVGGRAFGYTSMPVLDAVGREIGRRRVVDPAEAEAVRYIFTLYAVDGLTPRAVAHRLNAEGVKSPRTARRRQAGSWTPATIAGSTARAIGILNNPMYIGRVAWNRSHKLRDPESGKRVVRARPQSDWVWVDAPDLRIVSDELWEKTQARRAQRRFTSTGATGGTRAKFLLSGLCVCGECGGGYVAQYHRAGVRHFGCARHYDRGPTVCTNGKLVRQDVLETKILAHVFGDLFAPHKLDYLAERVDAAIAKVTSNSFDALASREAALQDARRELHNIAAAIRQGIVTPTTRGMLEETEQRVARLEETVSELRRRPKPAISVRASVEQYLVDLRRTLAINVDAARALLARGFDRIVLRRDGPHLWAEVRGNLAGILQLNEGELLARAGAGRGI